MPTYDYKEGDIIRAAQDYKVIALLGAGGMGCVYLAEHCELYRQFAVKLLNAELWNRNDLIEMFGSEARTVARLGEPEPHPGIIEVIDLGRTRDRARMPYMVMPYLHGETLAGALRRKGKLTLLEAIGTATHLCKALDHAHRRGVIHRDVKPANIFIPQTSEGSAIRVLDWGISKLLARVEDPNTFLGTPAWASKEQMLGQGIGPLSDVYSAAVVLFECLTGSLPFAKYGSSFKELAAAIHIPAPLLRHYGDFPRELEALVASALSKDPARRPQDALAFAEELQHIARLVRGRRDPHTHVTDRVEWAPRDVRASHHEPITEAHIAARTIEDPEVDKWVQAHVRKSLGGAPIASAPILTGFETTERKRRQPSHTEPMAGRPRMRQALTNVPGPVSAPSGPGSVRYVTAPVPTKPSRVLSSDRDTPRPVSVASESNEQSFLRRAHARWVWLFGSATWRELGRPMTRLAIGAMVVAFVVTVVGRSQFSRSEGISGAPTRAAEAPSIATIAAEAPEDKSIGQASSARLNSAGVEPGVGTRATTAAAAVSPDGASPAQEPTQERDSARVRTVPSGISHPTPRSVQPSPHPVPTSRRPSGIPTAAATPGAAAAPSRPPPRDDFLRTM